MQQSNLFAWYTPIYLSNTFPIHEKTDILFSDETPERRMAEAATRLLILLLWFLPPWLDGLSENQRKYLLNCPNQVERQRQKCRVIKEGEKNIPEPSQSGAETKIERQRI